ncbi:MAG: sugar phosphate isomerase/epimerase [Anaerolineales bacterium]|nr:sugar phosphate isomerase/epimerase [Anaerolineales bacterium]
MTRNKIGACTWIFGDMTLENIAQRLSAYQFDGVELMGDIEHYKPLETIRILKDHGLAVFSLTPDNVDLAHPDTAIRTKAIDYYLHLLDFAVQLGNPLVSCHGFVGRVRPVSTIVEEKDLFTQSVQRIAERALELDLKLVMEVLNRYEAHLLNTAAEALDFLSGAGAANVGILLDAYHMNIEEANPANAIRQAGDHLWLYHTADSNRQGIGRGHTDFDAQLTALAEIGYIGPIILECSAPGPDPFTAIKDEQSLNWLEIYLNESRYWLKSQA